MDIQLIRRLCFWAIGITALVFAVALASASVFMRRELVQQAQADARRDLEMASSLLYDRLGVARTALTNSVVPENVGDSRLIVENLLRHNDDLYGTAIAIRPEFAQSYLGKEQFMIYSHRTAADTLNTFEITDSLHRFYHYPHRDWYTCPTNTGKEYWTEPYYDSLTSGELMVSYSTPIYLSDSIHIGVLLADITLGEGIRSMVQDIDADRGYSTYLLSRDQQLVFGDTAHNARKVVLTKQMPETGWTLGHAIDRETLFRPVYRVMLNLTILFLLTVLILCFTIYYTISWMTRPAVKKQMRITAELDIAASIQLGLLPRQIASCDERNGLDIGTVIHPAKEVGGDFYNYFTQDERLYFILGDVSGKGVPAALFMAIATKLFMVSAPGKEDPAEIVGNINSMLTRDNPENMFVTLVVGVLDTRNGRLRLCNAGHNQPVIITDGGARMLQVETNIPTGVMGGFAFESETLNFPAGSSLVLYTDGVTEAENARHEQFGDSRLLETITRNSHAPVQELCDAIEREVRTFTAGFQQNDDITLLAVGTSSKG